jgi:glutathione S-transferase
VGEPALGAEGFGGDDGRTSIFDYWSMPELAKWSNGHRYDGGRLSAEQKALRAWYARLARLAGEPAFAAGDFLPLNRANAGNPAYGRLAGETASGHWLYAYVRHDSTAAQTFLVVVNLHPRETLRGVTVRFPPEALAALHAAEGDRTIGFRDRLAGDSPATAKATAAAIRADGLSLPPVPPLTAWYLEAR